MSDRLTDAASITLLHTRLLATELGGDEIEVEHLLLALLRVDRGPLPRLFAGADLSYADARRQVRAQWGERAHVPTSEEIPFSARVQRSLDYAADEADRFGHPLVGAGHFLLGILREEESSFALQILRSHGMTLEAVREQIQGAEVEVKTLPAGDGQVIFEPPERITVIERIRTLVDMMAAGELEPGVTVDEIHHHLDWIKKECLK